MNQKRKSTLFSNWLQNGENQGVSLYTEKPGSRKKGLAALKPLLGEHFVGLDTILKAGGYTQAANIIANSLPGNKRTQSGDLGELLATEYVNSETDFVVPFNKLRWKSDRQMPMHGNDIIALDISVMPPLVLKGECKSRATFAKGVAKEALDSLDLHDGRPNPSTLAFITKRLYEESRDSEAKVFQDLQCEGTMLAKNITHMIFALSGTDPSKHLAEAPKSKHKGIKRQNAAIVIKDHGEFITAVYKTNGA